MITGAGRGIGRAIAVRYAQEGAKLILVSKTQGALEETDDLVRQAGGSATLLPLDLADHEKIDQMAAAIAARFGHIDILVGNAALLGTLGPLSHHDPRLWEDVFKVNVTANWRLIRTLDPLLRRSDAGRVIFVTSGVARIGRAYWAPYSVTKAALEALAMTYANETRDSAIRVNVIDPGACV